jgi:signal transduction histidine kinase
MTALEGSIGLRQRPSLTSWIVSLLFITYVSARKLVAYAGLPSQVPALILLAIFLVLFLLGQFTLPRLGRYRIVYFLLQIGVIQALGLLEPYEDNWALLYIPLSFQAVHAFPLRTALLWGAAFTACLSLTLIWTKGWVLGVGFSLTAVADLVFFVSYELWYAGHKEALRESQDLLAELQVAHQKLKEYAVKAEELASIQERNRLAHTLHDSISQMLFSISLTAESARLLLDKDPQRVPVLLEELQDLTGQALAEMRALITQWRPG